MPRNNKAERTPEQEMADNEGLAYKKIINCTNAVKLRDLGEYIRIKLNTNGKMELRNYS
jgi:hypothetical protein